MWCYTELCVTTIFSATHRCNIGTMLQPFETMMQRCVALKPSLWIVSCNPHTVCKVDLVTSRAFERVARLWARSAIVRARSASERKFVPGPTTPDQKTKRTTLRKSICKGDVTRDDSQRLFWEQYSVAMLEQWCNHSKQCRNNVVMLCCAKNRRSESSRVTSPLNVV